jgi:hypothetical protein
MKDVGCSKFQYRHARERNYVNKSGMKQIQFKLIRITVRRAKLMADGNEEGGTNSRIKGRKAEKIYSLVNP